MAVKGFSEVSDNYGEMHSFEILMLKSAALHVTIKH